MSVMPEPVDQLGEASLQPSLPVNEGDREMVVFRNPLAPPRRGSSFGRDVIPNDDETNEEFVFRILGDRILKLAILDGPVGSSSLSRELALRYRLVCRGWKDTINFIYHTAVLPLFEYRGPVFAVDLVKVERMMRNLDSLTSLFAEYGARSAVAPPVSLEFSLSCLPIPLETKTEFEATAVNTLRRMGWMLLTLNLQLPHNCLEGINCSSLNLENLKYINFTFLTQNESTPATLGRWKIVQDIMKAALSLQTLIIDNEPPGFSAEMPELALPKSLKRLELEDTRIPMWLIDFAPTLKNMRQLVLNIGPERVSEQEPAGYMENLLISKLSKYLEFLELEEICSSSSSELSKRLEPSFSILEPMPKLRTLKLSFCCWKLGVLRSYKELLPSLTDLELCGNSGKVHFPASWYESSCLTLRRLHINILEEPSEAPLFSQQVLGRISLSFPNLTELDVSSDKCTDDGWQPILCQTFPNLRKLKMRCLNVSAEGINRLVAALSGIPLEELQAIFQGEKELEQVICNYQNCPSLRILTNLQELELVAYVREDDDEHPEGDEDQVDEDQVDEDQDDDEGQDNDEDGDDEDDEGVMYCRVMIYSTFLRMPNLKKVVLSSMFRITDELEQHARNETGLVIYTY